MRVGDCLYQYDKTWKKILRSVLDLLIIHQMKWMWMVTKAINFTKSKNEMFAQSIIAFTKHSCNQCLVKSSWLDQICILSESLKIDSITFTILGQKNTLDFIHEPNFFYTWTEFLTFLYLQKDLSDTLTFSSLHCI